MLSPRFVSTFASSAALVSLLLIGVPRRMHAQTAPSASTLTTNSGVAPANLTCTVGGSPKTGAPAPTGTVTFTDLTANQTLGTATLAGPATYGLQPTAAPSPSGVTANPVTHVASGDFNGDGIPDIAFVYQAGPPTAFHTFLRVMLGNRDGSFQPAIVQDLGIDSGDPMAPVVADFNGDNKADLVIAFRIGNLTANALVLLGNGNGTFQTPIDSGGWNAIGLVDAVAAGDFNGDGSADLAVASEIYENQPPYLSTLTLSILLGDGSGSFGQSASYTVTDEFDGGPFEMRAADLRNNGKVDVILDYPVGSPEAFQMTAMLGNGDGTFSGGGAVPSPAPGPSSFDIADFNEDGIPDMALFIPAGEGFGGVTEPGALQIDLGKGDGGFQQGSQYSRSSDSGEIVYAGDFHGNGHQDVLLYPGWSVYTGAGNGTLQLVNLDPTPNVSTSSLVPTRFLPYGETGPESLAYLSQYATTAGTIVPTMAVAATLPPYTFTPDAPALRSLQCSYGGDSNFSTSVSPAVNYVIPGAPDGLTSPTPNSVLPGPSVTFTWPAIAGTNGNQLSLGTTPGASDLYNSGKTTALSVTATGLPTNGETIYARLYTYFPSGTSPLYADYVFTAASQAAMTSPAPNAVLAGSEVAFTWTAGTGAPTYGLWLGTTVGGKDIRNTINLAGTSVTFSGLPTNGETIYARLFTNFPSGAVYTDYVFTAATETQAALTSPAPGSVLTGAQVTFGWTAGSGATGYILRLGTTAGALDIRTSGPVTGTQVTFNGLPTNGETIYARLFTVYPNGTAYTDYTFTAAAQSALISPSPGSTLTGTDLTFTWSAVAQATGYILRLGTTPGAYDVRTSGPVTDTSVAFSALPTNGATIYARLVTVYPSSRTYTDYVFTAATQSVLISPAPNSALTGAVETFHWSAVTGATGYKLQLGTTAGGFDIRTSGPIAANQVTFSGLPTNGETIYARLYTIYPYGSAYTDYVLAAVTQTVTLDMPACPIQAGPVAPTKTLFPLPSQNLPSEAVTIAGSMQVTDQTGSTVLLLQTNMAADQTSFSYARTVKTIQHATASLTFDKGCTKTDPYGSNNCQWTWGEQVTAAYQGALQEDVSSGKLIGNFTINGTTPFQFNCQVCGAPCTVNLPQAIGNNPSTDIWDTMHSLLRFNLDMIGITNNSSF